MAKSIAQINSAALAVAEKMSSDKLLVTEIEKTLNAHETTQLGRLRLMCLLRSSTMIGVAVLNAMPKVGSTYKAGSNELYDKYEDKDQEGKKITGSYFKTLADSFGEGLEINEALKGLRLAEKNDPGTPEEYASLKGDAVRCKQAIKRMESRRNYHRSLVAGGVQCHQQLADIQTNWADVVRCTFSVDTETKQLTHSPKPFAIVNLEDPSKFQVLSVGAFLALNTDRAEEKGHTYAALINSAAKAPAPASNKAVLKTGEDVTQWALQGAQLSVDVSRDADRNKKLWALVNGPGSDDLLLSIFEIADLCDTFTSKDDLVSRVETLKAERKNERKAA